MILLQLDTEEADLLMGAAAMAQAAMDARAARIDPDGMISKSSRMSAFKLAGVRRQLDLPPLPEYDQLPIKQRALVLKLCQLMIEPERTVERNIVWTKLRGIVLARDYAIPAVIEAQEPVQSGVWKASVESDSKDASVSAPEV